MPAGFDQPSCPGERDREREREIEGGRERAGESRKEKRREGEEERGIYFTMLSILLLYMQLYIIILY